jgi:uracil permease
VIYCIPIAVIGGLEVYLFGAIAVQGIAILVQSKCDVFSTRNVAVISTVLIIGLGGNYAFDGVIPFFGMEVPAISAAAVFGILLNWVLGLRSRGAEESGADSQDGDTD